MFSLAEKRVIARRTLRQRIQRDLRRNRYLFLMCLPAVVFFIIFHYLPMWGLQIAFKDFSPARGILGSEWAGLKHFLRFFRSFHFWMVLRNTLVLSFYGLAVGNPIPFVFALFLNRLRFQRYRRVIQTVTYAPHFISMVVLVGMITLMLSPRNGAINMIIRALGGEPVFFLGSNSWFSTVFVFSGVWQQFGWGMIIYLAALTAVDPQLYDAAVVDGAGRFQQIRHIDVPAVIPIFIILVIMRMGRIMNINFQKALLMQNPMNLQASEVIATYVYKTGLLEAQFSYGAAVGLFNTAVNFVLLIAVNRLSRALTETSLW
jgi:putative aldouronate transport system permease protein